MLTPDFRAALIAACLALLLHPVAALGADDCTTAPTCAISVSGPITIGQGETTLFTVTGQSHCDGDISIEAINAPSWCEKLRGGSDAEASFSCTPPGAGTYTLRFRVVDDENDMSDIASVTIEARGVDCELAPQCEYDVLTNPSSRAMITAGETRQFKFSYSSPCPTSTLVFQPPANNPDFCTFSQPVPDGNGGFCVTVTCSPSQLDSSLSNESHAGMHQITLRVVDLFRDEFQLCTLFVQVPPPDGCSGQPSCEFPNPGPIEIVAGETAEIEFCFEAGCPTSEVIPSLGNPLPDFCTMSAQNPPSGSAGCVTLTCSPGLNDIGPYQLSLGAIDLITAGVTFCSLQIAVVAPPDCVSPPTCEFVPAGPIEVQVGDTAQIEFRWSAGCDLSTANLLNEMLLPFCTRSPITTDSNGNSSITITCAPVLGQGGSYTQFETIQDNFTLQETTCSIDIEVTEPPECQDPPTCQFVPSGPIDVVAGESTQFEFRWSPGCSLTTANLLNPSLLPFCQMSPITTDSNGNSKATITCSPMLADAGMHTQSITVQDNFNLQETTCSIDINVIEPCPDEPLCYFTRSGPIEVAVGEMIDFEFCGSSVCSDHRTRIEMLSRPAFITPAGHKKGGPGETLCLPIKGTPGPQHAGTSSSVHVRTTNLTTGQVTNCSILIHVVEGDGCAQPPACEITQGETIEVGLNEPFDIEICAASSCSTSTVTIEPIDPTFLCDSFGIRESEPGEELCATLPCGTFGISEPGEHFVRFLVTDTGNGQSSICETLVIVGGGSPGCVEEEPNNDLALCTVLDARSCLGIGCGSLVSGYLDPSGDDVDLYCIEGLRPGAVYRVLAIGGVNQNLEFTCAQAVCIDESGARIGTDGSDQGTVECAADAAGTLFIGVSGCGDLDLDGMIDDESRGNPPHGFVGAYQVLISPASELDKASISCHADMNNDGIVNSADLGMLIGVFGEICAPE